MKVLKRLLAIFIIAIMLSVASISKVIAAAVNLTLTTQPYIDIVLSKAKTTTDLTNFETDLRNALRAQGIDNSKVNISAIDSFELAVTNNFNWQRYTHFGPDNSSYNSVEGDHIKIDSSDRSILFQGYGKQAYKDFLLYADTTSKTKTIEFTVDTTTAYWHTLDAAGFLVNSEIKNQILSGYAVMIRNGYISIYKFNDNVDAKLFSDCSSGSMLAFATVVENCSITNGLGVHKFKLIVEKDSIEVYDNDNKIIEKEIDEVSDTAHGFGPIASYNSHACSELSQIKFTDVHMTVENVKYFEEVLREPDWREDSIKVLVNVNDVVNEQLNAPTSLGELLNRMINDEIYYVGWGKSVNQAQTNNLIAANNNNGKFINNTSYSSSITQTAQYIKSLLPSGSGSNYVILGENTILSSTNANLMKNTAGGAFPYGRWKVVHDCEYFENNIGQFAQSGQYISNMITSFDKTGKYEIYYEDTATNPAIIYVHRKPVAEINVTRNGNSVTLSNLGYDLDKQSTNRGIQRTEWKYRQVGVNTWTNGQLTNISSGNDFLVQLRVQDYQNTWSAPVTKYITKNSSVPPIASFKIANKTCSVYERLDVLDGSYDPYGGTITSKTWKVYKGETLIYTGTTPLTNYNTSGRGTGDYTMSLEVTNNRGLTSEVYKRNFKIIPDNEAPEFTATPTDCEWQKNVTINLQFKDRLGSGFKNYQYAITTTQSTPSSWTNGGSNSNSNISITNSGTWYLHVKATDNAGNTSLPRSVGPYEIDATIPTRKHIPYTNCMD